MSLFTSLCQLKLQLSHSSRPLGTIVIIAVVSFNCKCCREIDLYAEVICFRFIFVIILSERGNELKTVNGMTCNLMQYFIISRLKKGLLLVAGNEPCSFVIMQ